MMLALRRRMPEGHVRAYDVSVGRGLFGGFLLEAAYGRVGWKARRRSRSFGDADSLAYYLRALLIRRRRNGYVVVQGEAAAQEILDRPPRGSR